MKKSIQISTAVNLGRIAHGQNKPSAPASDKDFIAMLEGRPVGQTPPGEASTIQLCKAWRAGWHQAHDIYLKNKRKYFLF